MKIVPLLGVCGVLLTASTAIADTAPSRADLVRIANEIAQHHAELDASFAKHEAAAQKLASLYGKLDEKSAALRKASTACANGCTPAQGSALGAASKELAETQMSFNLQYLQLQSQMQQESRSYTAVSNIMKTKHDTVKNSISNVR